MKFIRLLIVFILVPLTLAHGQQHHVDSLLKELESHPKEDTTRVKILNNLAFRSRVLGVEKAESYGIEGLKIAKKLAYQDGIGTSYRVIGTTHHARGDFKVAIEWFQKSLNIFLKTKQELGQANAYGNIGACYDELGYYPKAVEYYKKSKEIFSSKGEQFSVGICYYNMGIASEREGDFDKATEFLLESIKIAEEVNDDIGIAYGCHSLGNIQLGQKRRKLAIKNFKRAREIHEKLGNKKGIGQELLAVGSVLQDEGKYQEARSEQQDALKLFEEIGDKKFMAIAFNNIGSTYEDEKQYNQALVYHRRSLQLRQTIQSTHETLKSLRQLGRVYHKMGQFNLAKSYLNQSLDSALKIGAKDHIMKAYEVLSSIDSARGNFKGAYFFHKQYLAMKDSVFNDNKEKLITEMNLKYETEKKEREIHSQQMQLDRQELVIDRKNAQTTALVIGILLTLVSAIVFFRGRQKQKKANDQLALQNRQINEQSEEIKSQSEEIKSQAEELKITNEKLLMLDEFKQNLTGMIVHDLKNPLNIILSLSDNKQVKQAGQQMLTLTTNLLDTQKFEEAEIQLKNQDIFINELIKKALSQVQIVAEDKNIIFESRLSPSTVVFADSELITRVLVNLFTNSIKYSSNGGKISLSSSKTGEYIRIEVKDEGMGIPKEKQSVIFQKFGQVMAKKSGATRSTGIGLYFCKLAIEAHLGEIGVDSAEGQGANFWFTLPIGKDLDKIESTELSQTTTQTTLLLSEEDRMYLKPIAVDFLGTKIYELSKLRQLLAQIQEKNQSISQWKTKLKRAIDHLDEDAFQKILEEV